MLGKRRTVIEMLGYALMNAAHEEVTGVNTVGSYDICPFNKLFVNLLP